MTNRCTRVPQILMPKEGSDLYRWAVVACDQYTSQPDYWEQADEIVGDAPSTLRLILPEVYLEQADVEERIAAICASMRRYTRDGILRELPAGMVLLRRDVGGEYPHRGLMLAFDLEAYEYTPGSESLIRPTEKTVVERIPPRLHVRRDATIEVPHIMLMMDDPDRSVIEPLFERLDSFTKLYDTDLMQGGGHLAGWFIPEGEETEKILAALDRLYDRDAFNAKYGLSGDAHAVLPFAVGDGNHSMATAKAYWENVKKTLTPAQRKTHPARFVLAELTNIHDESIEIKAIHRVLFGVRLDELAGAAADFFASHGAKAELADAPRAQGQSFPIVAGGRKAFLWVGGSPWALPVATLQNFLDAYLASHPDTRIDYIHGDDAAAQLGAQEGNLCFLLPDPSKGDLFRGVILDGVLPRKTFSMGHAHEKRYYMECKKITL